MIELLTFALSPAIQHPLEALHFIPFIAFIFLDYLFVDLE